jgi:hypothetical protein
MSKLNIFFMAILSTLGLVKLQILKTFTKETALVDKEIVDLILSNPENKRELIKKLDQENYTNIEIAVTGKSFSIVTAE